MTFAIGVDVGGTKTAVARVSRTGRIDEFFLFETPKNPRELRLQVSRHVDFLLRAHAAVGIGFGVAGCVDSKIGTVSDSYNLFGAKTVNLKKAFKGFSLPMVVENDANAWAFAEYRLAKRKPHFLGVLTLGTGVGCGLVFEGNIFHGSAFASEFGHTVVDPAGFTDSAGIRGSLEAMANGASVVLRARKAGLRVSDAALVSDLGAAKNPKAVRALVETGFWAGIGIANLVNTLHLDSVVLAGGLSRSKILSESAKKTALKRLYPSFGKGLSIRASGLEMGACVGAALLAFER